MNELTRVLGTKYTCSVGKAYGLQNRTIGGTTLHYLAVWQAIHAASVHIPLCSKHLLIKLTALHPGEWFQGAIKYQGSSLL